MTLDLQLLEFNLSELEKNLEYLNSAVVFEIVHNRNTIGNIHERWIRMKKKFDILKLKSESLVFDLDCFQ